MPRLKFSSGGKCPTAFQDESRSTTADPMSELLTIISKTFEEVNNHLVDQDKRIEDLR